MFSKYVFLKMEITGDDESSKNSSFICSMISRSLNMLLLVFCLQLANNTFTENESYIFLSCFGGKLPTPLQTLPMGLLLTQLVLPSALSLS